MFFFLPRVNVPTTICISWLMSIQLHINKVWKNKNQSTCLCWEMSCGTVGILLAYVWSPLTVSRCVDLTGCYWRIVVVCRNLKTWWLMWQRAECGYSWPLVADLDIKFKVKLRRPKTSFEGGTTHCRYLGMWFLLSDLPTEKINTNSNPQTRKLSSKPVASFVYILLELCTSYMSYNFVFWISIFNFFFYSIICWHTILPHVFIAQSLICAFEFSDDVFYFSVCRWTGTTVWKWQYYAKKKKALYKEFSSTLQINVFRQKRKKHLSIKKKNKKKRFTILQRITGVSQWMPHL